MPGAVFVSGVVGDERTKPYLILILFYSLAYVCLSVDVTGVFEGCALWAARRAGTSPWRLFVAFFVVSAVLTVATSNDIVILSITPLICHFAKDTGADPLPYLVVQFYASNLASMALIIGNPTNVIIAGYSQGIPFLTYLQWMALPSAVATTVAFGLTFWMFRAQLRAPLHPVIGSQSPFCTLKAPVSAAAGILVLSVCLVLLMLASTLQLDMGVITALCAAVMLCKDVAWDVCSQSSGSAAAGAVSLDDVQAQGEAMDGDTAAGSEAISNSVYRHDAQQVHAVPVSDVAATSTVAPGVSTALPGAAPGVLPALSEIPRASPSIPPAESAVAVLSGHCSAPEGATQTPEARDGAGPPEGATQTHPPRSSALPPPCCARLQLMAAAHSRLRLLRAGCSARLPTVDAVACRLPWKLLPFVLSMFVMVEFLTQDSWVSRLAAVLAPAAAAAGPWGSALLMLVLSTLCCQVINNQPVAVLFARVLQDPAFRTLQAEQPRSFAACVYAVVAGTNVGACLTLIGALAGVMWITQVRAMGVTLTATRFAWLGCLVVPPIAVATALAIGGEAGTW